MSAITTTSLGGTASDIKIFKIGLGLMMMTWTPTPTPDEQAFEVIKTAISLVPADQKLFINSAEFYGMNPPEANLHLLARFFTKYPELADRTFLSVKGAANIQKRQPNGTPEGIRGSVENIIRALDGKKKLDLFECARVDPNVPIQTQMETLKALVDEGKIGHIGVSEIGAASLKKANEFGKIAAVEIEVSPWSYEEETKKVIATAKELGIPVVAYSPLGRGFLTGKLKREDLPQGDMRNHLARFQEEAFNHNQKIVDALAAIAEKKGVSAAQLSLAWVSSLGPHMVPLPGSSRPERVKENFAAANITFTEEELKEISKVIDELDIKGGRYVDGKFGPEHLWG